MEKITSDLLKCIPKSTNAITNTFIITSLGFLRYKNEDVLNAFCDTLFKKSINYKFHNYSSILQTFAALQFKSEKASSFIKVRRKILQCFSFLYIILAVRERKAIFIFFDMHLYYFYNRVSLNNQTHFVYLHPNGWILLGP